jgi:hypothetical protein
MQCHEAAFMTSLAAVSLATAPTIIGLSRTLISGCLKRQFFITQEARNIYKLLSILHRKNRLHIQ